MAPVDNRVAASTFAPMFGTMGSGQSKTAPAGNRGLTTTFRLRRDVMAEQQPTRPTSVYLYYDANDLLLYVGITSRGAQRQAEHNASKDWWRFVARQEVEHHPSRKTAAERERALIRQYGPPFNVVHNPDHAETRAAYIALATKDGLRTRNLYPALTRHHGKTRLAMDVERIGNALILRSLPEDAGKVRGIDVDARENLIVSYIGVNGAKQRLDSLRIDGGHLIATLHCRRHAARCIRADVMLRMPDGKVRKRPTVKRIDLYGAGGVI